MSHLRVAKPAKRGLGRRLSKRHDLFIVIANRLHGTGLPFWVVVKAKGQVAREGRERNTLSIENLFFPGIIQPRNSRSRPSASTLDWV